MDGNLGFGGGAADMGLFGPSTMQEFMHLQKSLEAGYPEPNYSGGGAGWPLMTQSIEMTLKWATETEEHVRLWKALPKNPNRLTSTVREYTRQTGLGHDLDFAMGEGLVGPLVDPQLQRLWGLCRFMSHKRQISDPYNLLANLVGGSPAMEYTQKQASLWMVRQLERSLIDGDDSVHPQSINGIYRACKDVSHVYDNRGAPIDTDAMYDIVSALHEGPNFGFPNQVWMSVGAKADIAKVGGGHVRFNLDPGQAARGNFKMGMEPTGLIGPMGDLSFEPSVYLAPTKGMPSVAIGENAPATPVVGSTRGADSAANPLFNTAAYGTYLYKVRACGAKGKSAPCGAVTVVVDSTAHNKVTLTMTAPGTDNVLYYDIFRTEKGGADYYKIGSVTQARDGGGVVADTDFVDVNADLPNTSKAFVIEMKPEVLEWNQLLDFARRPLAQTELFQPFAFVLYGMLLVYVPTKLWAIKNIGRAS